MRYYAMVKRADGTRFHAATIQATNVESARKLFNPRYGCGVLYIEWIPELNPSAMQIKES